MPGRRLQMDPATLPSLSHSAPQVRAGASSPDPSCCLACVSAILSSHSLLLALQVRAGAGGAEASLFAWELFRMYERFAQAQGWKFDVSYSEYLLALLGR